MMSIVKEGVLMKSTPLALRYRGATYRLVEADGSMTLYHIGPRPPTPTVKYPTAVDDPKYEKEMLKEDPDYYETGYRRPWLGDKPQGPVVFLSDDPASIYHHHGRGGNLYAYRVPMSVVKESGGLHKFDFGREILIPERLWDQVEFVGKVPESKFKKLLKDYHFDYSHPREMWPEKKERDLEKEEQQLKEHSQRKKLEKSVDRAKRRLNVTKVLDEAALRRQFINSVTNITTRFNPGDFPLPEDHPWYSSVQRMFNHWSGKRPERFGPISRITPSSSLKSVREIDPMVWDKQVQVLEQRFFV